VCEKIPHPATTNSNKELKAEIIKKSNAN